jgi:hypothetical protein
MGYGADFLKTLIFFYSSTVRLPFVANYNLSSDCRASEKILKDSENIIIKCVNARCAYERCRSDFISA